MKLTYLVLTAISVFVICGCYTSPWERRRSFYIQQIRVIDSLAGTGDETAIDSLKNILYYSQLPGLKSKALLALGKIGSSSSIVAINCFEAECEFRSFYPFVFRFGELDPDDPFNHWWEKGLPLAVCHDSGIYWAIFSSSLYNSAGMWVATSKDSIWWDEPNFTTDIKPIFNQSGLQEFKLEKYGNTLKFTCKSPKKLLGIEVYTACVDIFKLTADADSDGLTNMQEYFMGTDSLDQDTDNDGKIDGKDKNPLTPYIYIQDQPYDDIRQTLFYFLFGTLNDSRPVYVIGNNLFAWQEYTGYGGYVLKSNELKNYCNNITNADIEAYGDSAHASVVISYPDNFDVTKYATEFKLKRIFDRWVIYSATVNK